MSITVERPHRLRWKMTDDTLAAVAADKKVGKLPTLMQQLLVDKLRANQGISHLTEKPAKAMVRDALVSVIGKKPTPLVRSPTPPPRESVAPPSSPTSRAAPNPTPPFATTGTFPYPP